GCEGTSVGGARLGRPAAEAPGAGDGEAARSMAPPEPVPPGGYAKAPGAGRTRSSTKAVVGAAERRAGCRLANLSVAVERWRPVAPDRTNGTIFIGNKDSGRALAHDLKKPILYG